MVNAFAQKRGIPFSVLSAHTLKTLTNVVEHTTAAIRNSQYSRSVRITKPQNTGFPKRPSIDMPYLMAAFVSFALNDGLGYGKGNSLPTINTLKQEWAVLESERKSLYHGYQELKNQRNELVMAKDNCERLLGINKNAPNQSAGHERKQPHSHEI